MSISPDGVSVRFKTAPEEQFLAEKSGAKPNTVRIMEIAEADRIQRAPPTKIFIQYEQEIFLRTLTNICIAGEVLGKVIVIFSWTNEKHHHPQSLGEPSQDRNIILIAISKGMFDILQKLSCGRSTDAVIRELYQIYLTKHAEGTLHDQ